MVVEEVQSLVFNEKQFRLAVGSLELYQLHDIGVILRLRANGRSGQGDSCQLTLSGIFLIGVETINHVVGKTFTLQDLHRMKNCTAQLLINNHLYHIRQAVVKIDAYNDKYKMQLEALAGDDIELAELRASIVAKYTTS
ncbi:MAG: hypothetical protein RMM17_08480 [Acidobacteriota bacterium]|nr:hypothetical protein [Blastocatellia bacterium]MDW8412703.1 hypothetical protein [Acidobacteriota bacterium]